MADLTPDPEGLQITAEPLSQGTVLHVSGEIDMASGPALADALAAAGAPLLVDLAGVTFIDSSGLAVLTNAAHDAGRLVVRDPSPAVRRIIELTGLTAAIEFEDS